MIIPWRVDVPLDRRPYMNWLFILATVVFFVVQLIGLIDFVVTTEISNQSSPADDIRASEAIDPNTSIDDDMPAIFGETLTPWMLQGWSLRGLFGYMWLHGGLFHLLGNMLFLWIFGNAICAKIGNLRYIPVYMGLGVIAGLSHLIFQGGPVLGASGAINGIVGMYLILYPVNDITCYFTFFLFIKQFTISSYWIILLWFTFDILGAVMTGGQAQYGVAYFCHIGGFTGGVALAIIFLKARWITMERYETSLLEIFEKRKTKDTSSDSFSTYGGIYGNYGRELSDPTTTDVSAGSSAAEIERPIPVPDTIPFDDPPVAAGATAPTVEKKQIAKPPSQTPSMIRFYCSCGKRVKVPAKYAGKSGRCPRCKQKIRIPASTERYEM